MIRMVIQNRRRKSRERARERLWVYVECSSPYSLVAPENEASKSPPIFGPLELLVRMRPGAPFAQVASGERAPATRLAASRYLLCYRLAACVSRIHRLSTRIGPRFKPNQNSPARDNE